MYMYEKEYGLLPEEVKDYLDYTADINRKSGYEMYKILDIDCDTVETPDGETYSEKWAVTVYNVTSCMMICHFWCIYFEGDTRKLVKSFSEIPMGLAKKLARKLGEVA